MHRLNLSRSVANKTPYEENEKYKREVENLSYRRHPPDEDGFARADSDTSSEGDQQAHNENNNNEDYELAPAKAATYTVTPAPNSLMQSDVQLESSIRQAKARIKT